VPLPRAPAREVAQGEAVRGDCGRLTTAHETIAGGYCSHCAADTRWTLIA